MKTEEVIQRVQSLYSHGVESQDSRLTSRHIYNKLITTRAKLLSQQASKKQLINSWNYSVIPCVELIEADVNDCPCIPSYGCKIFRSKYELPRPIIDLSSHMIKSCTSVDSTGTIKYSYIDYNQLKYIYSNKYTYKNAMYFIRNRYLYTSYIIGPKVVSIEMLAEDPWEVQNFLSYCGCEDCTNCNSPLDMEFPIDNDLLDTMIMMTVQELIGIFERVKVDFTNNGQDDNSSDTEDEVRGGQQQ